MKQLSYWASQHIWAARAVIFLSYILVNVAGILLACLLPANGLATANLFALVAILSTIIATIYYPSKNKDRKEETWHFRKLCDFMLCIATLLFTIGNTTRVLNDTQPVSAYAASRHDLTSAANEKPTIQSTAHTNNFFQRLHTFHNWYPRQSTALKILIVFGVIVSALAVTVGWTAVCCGIACGGSEALAICVFFAGFAGIVFWAVLLIQKKLHTGRWKAKAQVAE